MNDSAPHEARQVWPPILYRDQPRIQQLLWPPLGAILLGAICGWLLGQSEIAYLVLTTLAIAGGLLAGYEHVTAAAGALRGLVGGVIFALSIAETHRLLNEPPLAEVPDPIEWLVPIFATISVILGVIGASLRRKREARG